MHAYACVSCERLRERKKERENGKECENNLSNIMSDKFSCCGCLFLVKFLLNMLYIKTWERSVVCA